MSQQSQQPEPEPESAPPPRILKVRDPPSHKIKPLHPHLPQPPACVLMVSPVKTGKSTIISNLISLTDSPLSPAVAAAAAAAATAAASLTPGTWPSARCQGRALPVC